MARVTSSEFFQESELRCKCGNCHFPGMDIFFMDALDGVRVDYGHPIVLSSAYRCPTYNNEVSSTGKDGPHTTGKAVDIHIAGEKAFILLEIIFESRTFDGIGIKQNGPYRDRFIHIDSLTAEEFKGPRPWIWSY